MTRFDASITSTLKQCNGRWIDWALSAGSTCHIIESTQQRLRTLDTGGIGIQGGLAGLLLPTRRVMPPSALDSGRKQWDIGWMGRAFSVARRITLGTRQWSRTMGHRILEEMGYRVDSLGCCSQLDASYHPQHSTVVENNGT